MAYFFLLILTLASEGVIAYLFGFREKKDQLNIALINGTTHPLFVSTVYSASLPIWTQKVEMGIFIFFLEACVVVIEFLFLRWLYPKKEILFLFLVSLVMNGSSAFIGSWIFLRN